MALYRTAALAFAKKEIGVKESPANSNRGPRVDQYESVTNEYGEPWCASFVQWCFKQAGMPQPFLARSAYVPYILAEAAKDGWLVTTPEPGDCVCFDWEQDGEADHIGFVASKIDKNGNFNTVEGNTAYGNDSNGGEVMFRTRHISEVAKVNGRHVFVRVPGSNPVTTPAKPVAPMWAWFAWKDAGSPKGKRPASAPKRIPAAWWARYLIHRGIKKKK